MKPIILAIIILFFGSMAYAELYAVKQDDGSISIVNYFKGSLKSIDDVFKDVGFLGKPTKLIGISDIPSRIDRKYWRLSDVPGPKIIVDLVAKQADLDAETAKEAKKEAVRIKMKISKKDWEDLNEK